jgi:hypothetical protein
MGKYDMTVDLLVSKALNLSFQVKVLDKKFGLGDLVRFCGLEGEVIGTSFVSMALVEPQPTSPTSTLKMILNLPAKQLRPISVRNWECLNALSSRLETATFISSALIFINQTTVLFKSNLLTLDHRLSRGERELS